jgi:Holliday junction resolvasome RuvABC endonuclease subunit
MVVAGIDQSLTHTGITIYNGEYLYYLIDSQKEESSSPSIEYTRRIIDIKNRIHTILQSQNVDVVGIEGMAFGSRGRAVFDLGGLSHIIREMLIEKGYAFIVLPPTVVKKYWTGKGNASKDVMIEEAYNRKCNIDILKNYGNKKQENIQFDDNVVDSRAICDFVLDFQSGKIREFESMIELSF